MSFLEILILAVVQGLTEFLPVSSSGHLVVANALLESLGRSPARDLIEVSIVLHLGTLLAVLVYYWREIVQLAGSHRRVIPLLIVGTIPAAVIGVPFNKFYPEVLKSPLLAGLMFPVTALLLIMAMRRREGEGDYPDLSMRAVLGIGLLQAFALLPGISRSGSTIAAGIFFGLKRESAATFAFLLAIPAIAGGGVLKAIDAYEQGTTGTPLPLLAVGFVVSFVVGLAALWLLIRFVARGRLALFAWYLIPLGVAVTVWRLVWS